MTARHDTTSRFFFIRDGFASQAHRYWGRFNQEYSLFPSILSIPGDVWIRIFGYSTQDPKHQTDRRQGEFPAVFASSRDSHEHRGDRAGHDASGNESTHGCFVSYYLVSV